MVQQIITLRDMEKYADQIFTGEREARKAAPILKGILDARSSRISEIVQYMGGSSAEANTKQIHRWLKNGDPDIALMRLYNDDTPYVIVDVTEVERPQAKRTKYVGVLKDGQTLGFDLLMLATPYRGRALPFHCISYSSRTIAEEKRSRNMEHRRAIANVMSMLGDTPLVFDREFSYESFYEDLEIEGLKYVIRLNIANNPTLTHEKGKMDRKVKLDIAPGKTKILRGVYYKGNVKMNLIGYWKKGMKEAMWIATNIEPKRALEIYLDRMKIEESFKDLKSLLGLERIMSKDRQYMEKLIMLVLIAYTIGVLVGEKIRDRMYRSEKKMEPLFWPFYSD
jgi:hypothetical protein